MESEKVRSVAKKYYSKPNSKVDWNDWVWDGHNEVVAHWVRELRKKYEFDEEAVLISAYLHDIAYAWTSKNDPTLDEQSLSEARKILIDLGFANDRIEFIVDKIITGHSMQGDAISELIEARIFSTADALAHFTTDFYLVMCWNHYLFENKSLGDYKTWLLKKIERDFNNKIFFEDFKALADPYYKSLQKIFGNPTTLEE